MPNIIKMLFKRSKKNTTETKENNPSTYISFDDSNGSWNGIVWETPIQNKEISVVKKPDTSSESTDATPSSLSVNDNIKKTSASEHQDPKFNNFSTLERKEIAKIVYRLAYKIADKIADEKIEKVLKKKQVNDKNSDASHYDVPKKSSGCQPNYVNLKNNLPPRLPKKKSVKGLTDTATVNNLLWTQNNRLSSSCTNLAQWKKIESCTSEGLSDASNLQRSKSVRKEKCSEKITVLNDGYVRMAPCNPLHRRNGSQATNIISQKPPLGRYRLTHYVASAIFASKGIPDFKTPYASCKSLRIAAQIPIFPPLWRDTSRSH